MRPMRFCNPGKGLLFTACAALVGSTVGLQADLSEPDMRPVRHAFDTILSHHEPYPAIVLNRSWDLVKMNDAFTRLFMFFPAPPFDPKGCTFLDAVVLGIAVCLVVGFTMREKI